MKKLLMMMILCIAAGVAAHAQTESKVKPATTPTQKVHNTFSRNKRYKGVKAKTKADGHKTTTETNTNTGAMKTKQD